jgi:hypothetical protein
MPAPAGKVLWNAKTVEEWESAYDRWLGHWAEMGIIACKNLPKLNLDRSWIFAQRWLEEADEFGVMYMALGENFLSFGANILL